MLDPGHSEDAIEWDEPIVLREAQQWFGMEPRYDRKGRIAKLVRPEYRRL